MLLRTAMLLCALMPCLGDASVVDGIKTIFAEKAQPEPVKIRVLVAHDQPGVMFETKGKYRILNPQTGDVISTRLMGKRKFIQTMRDGLKWGEEFPLTFQMQFSPDAQNGPATTIVEGKEYRGDIYVYNVNGNICVVNEVELEDYLNSVLTLKYREAMPQESLAAFVIAERTKAYYQAINPHSAYFAVSAEEEGYHGYAVTLNRKAPGLDEAIANTKNMVMSRTAAYEGVVTPIPASFAAVEGKKETQELARIDAKDVEEMAKQGSHAAQILSKAFPQTSIQVIQ